MTAVVKPEPVAIVTEDQRHGLVRLVAKPDYLLQLQEETREASTKLLQEGRDFGKIPGVNKPSLWKSGAERLGVAFGLVPEYAVITQEVDHDRTNEWAKPATKYRSASQGTSQGLYRYVVRCSLVDRAGQTVGSAVAACSTLESKYIDRPRDSENTVVQMAAKRAYIAAVRQTLGLSDQFTQDVEDQKERFQEEPETDAPTQDTRQSKQNAAKRMPFGKFKGTPLGEMRSEDLSKALIWCRAKDADKFASLITALEEVLNDRADTATETLEAEKEPEASTVAGSTPIQDHHTLETFKASLEEDEDSTLPF